MMPKLLTERRTAGMQTCRVPLKGSVAPHAQRRDARRTAGEDARRYGAFGQFTDLSSLALFLRFILTFGVIESNSFHS